MASPQRRAGLALASDPKPGPQSADEQAETDAKLEVSNGKRRTREQAKREVADRNEEAHKRAKVVLAEREQLKRDMRRGLEF